MSNNLLNLSSAQLMRAAKLRAKIQKLEKDLAGLLGESAPSAKAVDKPARKKRHMSAAARASIAAAQRERWKRVHAAKAKS